MSGADDPIDMSDDDRMIAALADALNEQEAMPASIERFGLEAHRLVSFAGEFAAIVEDSMSGELMATRSATDVRTVRFAIEDEAAGITVDIELEIDDELAGSIEPRCDEVSIVTASDRETVAVNQRGFFRADRPNVPFRIECVVDGTAIRTAMVGGVEDL